MNDKTELQAVASATEGLSSPQGELQRLVMRLPHNEQERLFAALNSTDGDIFESTNGRVYVTGKNKDGDVINLGSIGIDVFFHHKRATTELIERIRFGCS